MTRNTYSTLVLLGLNVLVFAWLAIQQQSLMMNRSVDVLAILHAGANLNPFTLGGEPWRILTSMFLHFGVIHLAVNMYALYSLGKPLESALGSLRFLLLYLICGIVAGLASLLFNLYTISAGASGAIFGLYGYRLGAELIGNFNDRERLLPVVINFIIFVIINALITSQFNVDLSGHIGGCLAGLVLSLLHYRFHVLTENIGLAVVLFALSLSMLILPKDQLHYYRIFHRVIEAEKQTDLFFGNNLSDEQLSDSLSTILPVWDSIQSSLHGLKRVPPELSRDTASLSRYVSLRKQETFFRIALIDRESYVYLDSLEIVSHRFDSLPRFDYSLNYSITETDAVEVKQDTVERAIPAWETKRIFYDAAWKEINDPSASVYYRIGTTDSLGRWQGPVRDYYRSGNIQMKGKYVDGLKDGVFLYYSDRGTYSSAGRYNREEAVGKWENYHWNGVLHSEIYYNDGAYTRSVWDSLGRAQVVQGKGKSVTWHSNGQVAEEGIYEGGRKEGDWFGFFENGDPYYHEYYRDNRLIRGVSEDKTGKRYIYDQLSFYPFPVIGMPEYNQYLKKNLHRPETTANKTGIVKVIFSVGVDGTLWDFAILQSLDPEYDQEAIRLVKEGPGWRPGLLHGHVKLPSQGYVEVTF
jgi:membrane associated rhomboid family serine protease/antitoxin component YwqK of YwqJK toxin-antitoxin module